MEVNGFRVTTLDSWETCAAVPFCHPTYPITSFLCSWLRQERTLVRGAFAFFCQRQLSRLSFSSSTIIEDVKTMCDAGQASMAFFYFDFRDINKQHWRDPVPSLLIQLSAQSSPCCDILSRLYSSHGNGAQQPKDDALKRCLIEMLTVQDRHPMYLIMDALDECSNVSG